MTSPDLKGQIADEILHTALERLDADEELMAIVGSWGDTLDDADVLTLLRNSNAGRPTLHRAHRSVSRQPARAQAFTERVGGRACIFGNWPVP